MDLIINFTPTGMIPTKSMTSRVPVTVEEIVEDVYEASRLGITIVHLHARNEQTGLPTYRAEVYGKIIEGIRAFNKELIVCVSLSGRGIKEFAHRAEPLQLQGELKPDMGSLTLSSLNFNKVESINSPDMIMALAAEMKSKGILPELEAFDLGMINYAKYLEKKNLLQPPHYFNLLFGNVACVQADLLFAGLMIKELPPGSVCSLGGIGDCQMMMNSVAIAAGSGVRVGLEDNIWYDTARTRLASNIDLIKRVHVMAEVNERQIMKPADLRKLLNLQEGNGKYGRLYE
ncbi:MAG: 3-keto-5-aminohexanoate cleavage protein [Taibaiella sp.]|nr:3-keto-5-aminohexanoate cleavage protein [Taibaiella sp.]